MKFQEIPQSLCHSFHMNNTGYVEVYEHTFKDLELELGFISSLPIPSLNQIISKPIALLLKKEYFYKICLFNAQLNKQQIDYQDLLDFKLKNFTTYQFVLLEDGNISLSQMQIYVQLKMGEIDNENLLEIYNDLEYQLYKDYYKKNLFYFNKKVYNVLHVFDFIWVTSIEEYFQYIIQNSDIKMSEILDYYEFSQYEFYNELQRLHSIGYLVYAKQFQKDIPSFKELREMYKQFQEYNLIEFEPGCPLAVVVDSNQIIDPLNEPVLNLIPINQLKKYFFTAAEFDQINKLPQIMKNIYKQNLHMEFYDRLNIRIENIEDQAFIGESVFKCLSFLTNYNDQLICDDQITLIAERLNLISYNNYQIFHAFLGSAFQSNYTLCEAMHFLFQIGHPIWTPKLDLKYLIGSFQIKQLQIKNDHNEDLLKKYEQFKFQNKKIVQNIGKSALECMIQSSLQNGSDAQIFKLVLLCEKFTSGLLLQEIPEEQLPVNPSVLSDMWMELCGTIFLNDGVNEFLNVFGKIYGRHINNLNKSQMEIEMIQKLQIYSGLHNRLLRIIVEPEGKIFIAKVFIENIVVGKTKHHDINIAKLLVMIKTIQQLNL